MFDHKEMTTGEAAAYRAGLERAAALVLHLSTRPGLSGASKPKEKASITAKLMVVALVCCILEGAGRKWLVPGSGPATQAIFYFARKPLAANSSPPPAPKSLAIAETRM